MTEQVRISRTAVASLVLGLLFHFPLIPAVLAVILGIMARRRISRSEGRYLGKGLATAGAILGLFQGILWSFALFSGSFYGLNLTESAVITRFGKIQKTVETPGLHFKMPLLDEVHRYPSTHRVFVWQSKPFEFETADGHRVTIRGKLCYRICNLELYWRVLGAPNEIYVSLRLEDAFCIKIMEEARKQRYSEFVQSVRDPSFQEAVHSEISGNLNRFGICVLYEKYPPWLVVEPG